MKIALLAGALALTACQGTAPLGVSAAPQVLREADGAGHLWISVSTSTHYPSIERFKLVDGVPETPPDLVYDGYGGDIAVSGDGTLYADEHAGSDAVSAFPPNTNQPNRSLSLRGAHSCDRRQGGFATISTIASDSAGYLYVGIYTTGTAQPRYPRFCEDVAIYSPTANGQASPIELIRFPKPHDIQSLAVDGGGDLFVDDTGSQVDEFTHPTTHPERSRVFKSGIGNAHSIASDSQGNLYIASTDPSYQNGQIERYSSKANPSGKPTSIITLPAGVHELTAIGVRGNVLYVDDVDQAVDLYRARKNGSQSPFKSLAAPDVVSIATGP